MRKYLTTWCICSIVLFAAFGFSNVKAADMTITSLSPANNAVGVCADTKLWITFGTTPIVATSGNLQICKVSDDSVVYQLNLQTLSNPPSASGWPYQITLNGLTINYLPFAVSGNTLEIHPSTYLAYNTEYYVKMTAGFCTDSGGNTSPAITDNTTWRFTTKASAPAADYEYIIAPYSAGDFCTLQGAVDAVADNDPNRTLIKIKNGTYRGIVYMPSTKINVTWLGENRDMTILKAYNREGFNPGTDYRMVAKVAANGFRMYNLTLHNTTPDGGGQAETIKHSGQKYIAENCKFLSYQDTLLLNGQAYFKNCYIEGDTDYIWGYGTVYFDKCEMRSLSNTSHITQPRAAQNTNGLFLVDCNLTSPSGISGCDLGRTTNNSYPYCQSVYINCIMPSTLFLPVGWKLASGTTTDNLRWWEYKSVTPSGVLINVSSRLNPGSRQLTDEEAVTWRDVNNVFSYNPWNPKAVSDPPTAAWQPNPINGATGVPTSGWSLTWSAGAGATSHMVYFGTTNPPEFVAEQTDASFATGAMIADVNYYWRVDEKNSAGTTTGEVWSFTTTATLPTPDPMTFETAPYAVSYISITMIATTAASPFGVEYYFANITDPNHNSGWQNSTTYTDTGLRDDTTYTYTVKARDKSTCQNETAASTAASATTPADFTAPTPDPITFETSPYASGYTSITMVATTATDISGVEYYFTCTAGGGHNSGWQNSATYTDIGLTENTTYTYTVKARDKSSHQNETAASTEASATTLTDTTAPTPDPMTFETAPYPISEASIAMVASTASDLSGVEYYFTCTAGGGHNSDWQNSTTYIDNGLLPSTIYTYTVKARDKSLAQNETAASSPASATTEADPTPPMPNPMTWAIEPNATDINSITMTATTATDISGVEYYFANITDPNHDSGWQDDTTYTDTELTNNMTYTYSVIARDKSLGQNETAWSSEANATTMQYNCFVPIVSDLDNNCEVDFLDYALMTSHWNETLPLNNNIAVNGTFDTDIMPGWQTFDLPSAVGTLIVMYDDYSGNPAGSAGVGSYTDTTGTSGHYFYQVLPVRIGKQYKFSTEWTGDLSGLVASDPCNLSNWARVLVAFETNADANTWTIWTDPNAVMYGKVFGVANQNIDSSGAWSWESITASQINGPADGVFTASGNYMVVAFSEGGLPGSDLGYFYADNVKVEGPECSPMDFNDDCYFDLLDIAEFTLDWLTCNRNPAEECWQ